MNRMILASLLAATVSLASLNSAVADEATQTQQRLKSMEHSEGATGDMLKTQTKTMTQTRSKSGEGDGSGTKRQLRKGKKLDS